MKEFLNDYSSKLALNKHTYERDFKPIYNSINITPNKIFQTLIILPFELPFSVDTRVTMALNNDHVVTFIFGLLTTMHEFPISLNLKSPIKVEIARTIVEIDYITQLNDFNEIKKSIEDPYPLFESCLEKLNFFILSYLVNTRDVSAFQVTTNMLDAPTLYQFFYPKTMNVEKGAILLHLNVPHKRKTLEKKKLEQIIRSADYIHHKSNPLLLPSELFLNSERYLRNGQYREAIIYSQTAFETFLRVILSEFYKIEGIDIKNLELKYSKLGFIKILKSEYSSRTGGKWEPNNPLTKIGKWYKYCYKIRNRIVHGGFMPTQLDTRRALKSTSNAVDYIIKLIKNGKKKYKSILTILT